MEGITMARSANTTVSGSGFSQEVIDNVWAKAAPVPLRPGFATDICGATIEKSKYGKLVTTGWEIDHIYPVAKGGTDNLSNLQPMQWENNRAKGDSISNWKCVRTS
jgi:5-methylcytosine-specific restriction endonuclease McrA